MSGNYIFNPEVIFRKEDEEAVLFNPRNGKIWFLNSTGTFIYSMLNGEKTIEMIVGEVTRAFNINASDDVKKQIEEYLDRLYRMELVLKVK